MANSNYGFNILASDMANYNLSRVNQSGVRTWENLFKNAQLDYNTQAQLLQTDYSDAIATAYKANLERQNAIANRGYSAGYTNELLGANRQQLLDTYTQAMQSYAKGASTIQENYMQNVSTINETLMQQSTYQKLAQDSALDYVLSKLATAQRTQPGMVKDQVDTYNLYKDYGLDWIYTNEKLDEKGNIIEQSRLKDRQELLGEMYTDGQLNEKGKQLYDIAYNFQGTDYLTDGSATMNYLQWLSKNTDKKYEGLYDWLGQADPYNYTLAGTNFGSVKQFLGLESGDYKYDKLNYSQAKEAIHKNLFIDISDKQKSISKKFDTTLDDFGRFARQANAAMKSGGHLDVLARRRKREFLSSYGKLYNEVYKTTKELLDNLKKTDPKIYNEFTARKDYIKELEKIKTPNLNLKDLSNIEIRQLQNFIKRFNEDFDKYLKERPVQGNTSGL